MSTKSKIRDSLVKRSGLLIFLLVILGAISLIRIASTHGDIQDIAEIDLPLVEVLTRIETNQLEQSINLERAIRYAQGLDALQLAEANFISSDSTFRFLAKEVDRDLLDAQERVKLAMTQTDEPKHNIKLQALLLSLKKLEIDHTSYEEHAFEVLNHLEEGSLNEALIAAERVEREEDEFNKRVASVLVRHELFTEALVKIVEDEEVLSMNWIIVLTLIFVIAALILAYIYSFRIWRPLEDIRQGAISLGDGKLDTRLRIRGSSITEDIVDAFNNMAIRLQHAQNEIEKFVAFSYRTSHDLKAPIENAQSLVSMMDRNMPEANFQSVKNNATISLKKLEETVNALSQVNRLREDLKSDMEETDIPNLIDEIERSHLIHIKEAKAIIKKKLEVENLIYPSSHLTSILQNLLTNSLKYRDPDKPLVIEVRTFEKNGSAYLLWRDTGLGFDAVKYQDIIFKPFERLHVHKTGSGLGLYLVKTIVDFHKGKIQVKSEPKKGAQFMIKLN
jgi:signal transduction histidine kinase